MEPDDQKLIDAFQKGDPCAFDALYRRYARRVMAFAHQLTGSRSEAEDLTQEVFIGAFQGLPRFRRHARLLTWLLGIAVRRWRDKRRYPRPPLLSYEEGEAWEAAEGRDERSDTMLEHNAARIAIEAAMRSLSEPLRQAFLLVVVQERTCREAAQILGCPVGTIKWRVAEALRQVRAQLQQNEKKEEEHETT